jgi:hypothetical protein
MRNIRNPLLPFTLLLVWLLAGCNLPTGGGPGPRVWIDTPLTGDELGVGLLIVQSHASSENGPVSAALLVNGVQVRVDGSTIPDEALSAFTQAWEPTAPGEYILEVVATDQSGNTGRSNLVKIKMGGTPLPRCSIKQLVAPEIFEPSDGADVSTPVHFSWAYPGTSKCHPQSFAISISTSADISDIGWGFITYDEHTTSRDWRLPAGGCYLLAGTGIYP